MANHLINAMFSYLRLLNKDYDFNLDDPMPTDDHAYGTPNQNWVVLFDASKDDPNFKAKKTYNVVTDGNQATSRRLFGEEKALAKTRLRGRPRTVCLKKPTASVRRTIMKKPAGKSKLCPYAKKIDEQKASRTHTGGLYATVDLEKLPNKGNLVLHVVEMLNSENVPVKEFALHDMKSSGMPVNEFCHDCSCQFKRVWEANKWVKYCTLDGFHSKTHKCRVPRSKNKRFNSQAAEQLWSRLDNLHFMTEYSRARYRYFLKNYFVWRNEFLRTSSHIDVNPAVSRRQRIRNK